jgi:peptidoglycan LD-endopeptidase CwlK
MANLNGLNPYVKEKAEELLNNANARLKNYKMGITEGYRSKEEQDALYAKGRTAAGSIVTNAKGGQSMHNYGLAIDFALFTADGKKAFWDIKVDSDKDGKADWMEVVEEGKKLGFEWGGDWKTFKDYPHFQMLGGLTEAQVRAGKVPNFKSTSTTTPITEVASVTGGNSNIVAYQKFINGYASKAKFTKLVEDGYTGPKTKAAYIRVYQYLVGVTVDGVFGPKSKKAAPIVQKGKSSATWNKFVQGLLYCHGYDPRGFDGIFGNGMLAAVKKFQKDKKLTQDGIVGPNTFAKFFA